MTERPGPKSIILIFLLTASLWGILQPALHAQVCEVKIDSMDFPPKVGSGQTVEVRARLVTTCTTSANVIVGRADLREQQTGRVLSSDEFSIGYITEAQKIMAVDTSNTAQAPEASGAWKLNLHVSLFAATILFAATEQPFEIQVGTTTQETLTEVSVFENGDFENGLAGWQIVGRPAGYSTISTQFAHTGSASVQIDLLQSGQVINTPEVQGVSQTSFVKNLRDMKVEAWFLMRQTSTAAAARLQVQIGDLTLNYYISYGNKPRVEGLDSTKSKSMFILNVAPNSNDWGTWIFVGRNVKEDFQSIFGLDGALPFQGMKTTPIVISLELLGFGATSDQLMFWDDLKVLASVPVEATNTTITTTQKETSQTSAMTKTGSETTTQAGTGLLLNQNGLLIVAVLGLLVLVVAVLAVGKRGQKRTEVSAPRVSPPTQMQFCMNCGAQLPPDSKFCNRCGSATS